MTAISSIYAPFRVWQTPHLETAEKHGLAIDAAFSEGDGGGAVSAVFADVMPIRSAGYWAYDVGALMADGQEIHVDGGIAKGKVAAMASAARAARSLIDEVGG